MFLSSYLQRQDGSLCLVRILHVAFVSSEHAFNGLPRFLTPSLFCCSGLGELLAVLGSGLGELLADLASGLGELLAGLASGLGELLAGLA